MKMLKILTLQNGSLEENAYLLYRQGSEQAILIDPGSEALALALAIEENGFKLGLILATHGHADHVGAVEELKERFKVPFACSGQDEALMQGTEVMGKMMGNTGARRPKIDQRLEDGQQVAAAGISLKVIATPGHTPGGLCFYHAESDSLFSGDTLFEGSVGRQDLPGGDPAAMRTSLQKKIYTLPPQTRVYPGHGGQTTLGREREHNPFIRAES